MRWGSFDPFLIEDVFWQDKMGMPVANKEFLRALLQYGSFQDYSFFCEDSSQRDQLQNALHQIASSGYQARVNLLLQVFFKEELKKNPIDIMHNGDFTYFMPYLIELRNRMDIPQPFPVIGLTHSLDTTSLHAKCIQLLLASPCPFDTIICTSRCAVEMLKATFEHIREAFASSFRSELPKPPSFTQIPLGIPEEAFTQKDSLHCRKALGIPPHHFVMLSLARFSPRRKMDLAPLLECIEWLKSRKEERFPDFTLILAGAGRTGDFKLVQDMIMRLGLQQEVRLESNVSTEKKMLLFGASDVFLSLVDNYQETFGLTIIEAMAQGLPVVASDFDGYKDLVVQGRTGFLIRTCVSMEQEPWDSLSGLLSSSALRFYRAQKVAFDLSELSQALLTLSSNGNLRKDLSTRSRARAASFQWRWIIGLYEELWRERTAQAAKWAASSGARAEKLPVLTPSIGRSFAHYPTERLTASSRITLSHYGSQRNRESFRPILYEEMAVVLDEQCREFMIHVLSGGVRTVAEVLDECRQHSGFPREFVLLQLDWLMKHGYVTLLKKNSL